MNYKKTYDCLIQSAIQQHNTEDYIEHHHIIPKCIGGSNDKANIVVLNAKQHYVAHHLLTKIYPDNYKLQLAFLCMIAANKHQARHKKISAKEYAKLRKITSKCIRTQFKENWKQLSDKDKALHKLKTREGMKKSSKQNSAEFHAKRAKIAKLNWQHATIEQIEQHRKNTSAGAKNSWAKLTPEQRKIRAMNSAIARKKIWKAKTKQQLEEHGRKTSLGMKKKLTF